MNVNEVARALTYLDMERLDMGDDYSEVVEYLCETAGIDFDSDCSDEDENYYEKKSIEAYEQLIRDGKIMSMIESIVEENCDNYDRIRITMVYNAENPVEITEHPTVKAVCVINDFIQGLTDDSCSKEHRDNFSEMTNKLLAVDIKLCYFGNLTGHSFFRYLNPEYYFISNDAYTVGHILDDEDLERELGEYTIHASLLSSKRNTNGIHGFTVSFNRNEDDIIANIYTYACDDNSSGYKYQKTECSLVVDTTDLEAFSKKLAEKINNLTITYC